MKKCTLTAFKADRISDTQIRLSWQAAENSLVKIYQGYSAEKAKKGKQLIGESTNGSFTATVPALERVYFLLEANNELYVIAERVLPLEGANNFRDFGGYLSESGQQVKWGVFYRSDHLNRLTDNDIRYLKSTHLRSIVDYRNLKEYSKQPNREWDNTIRTIRIIPDASSAELAAKASNDHDKIQELLAQVKEGNHLINGSGAIMEEQNRDFIRNPQTLLCYRQLIDVILDTNNMPMNQHCRGGKDRTGFGAAIILYLLGVSMEDIIDDYMLTGVLRAERNQRRMEQYQQETQEQNVLDFLSSMMETRASYLQVAFDEMVKTHGSVDNFMQQALKITSEEKTTLRELYLY